MLLSGRPTRDEPAHLRILVVGLPNGKFHFLRQCLHLVVGQDYKLLVGRRIEEESVSFFAQGLAEAHCHCDGVTGDVEVEIVGEQDVKLYAYRAAFCRECAVAFDDVEEVPGRVASRKFLRSAADILPS